MEVFQYGPKALVDRQIEWNPRTWIFNALLCIFQHLLPVCPSLKRDRSLLHCSSWRFALSFCKNVLVFFVRELFHFQRKGLRMDNVVLWFDCNALRDRYAISVHIYYTHFTWLGRKMCPLSVSPRSTPQKHKYTLTHCRETGKGLSHQQCWMPKHFPKGVWRLTSGFRTNSKGWLLQCSDIRFDQAADVSFIASHYCCHTY